ncbi:Adenosine deaminase [Alteromonas sp. 38]|uniref:adenosine deaminase family protein n=1 Tax=unclassified Alteromonas TaxID=2614992 RepID=UPI0012F44863|nr:MULTISPECIES: adenosine deaminase [unclassified Alteromonas]CAD5280763.1 Adenosine deaminase [Alteromonas sp. 154]VXB81880.1 Adenosine deaminase [Alteromonas sp. 38]
MRLRLTLLSFPLVVFICLTSVAIKSAATPSSVASSSTSSFFSMPLWFESFKQTATPRQMYQFLQAMPKGGDLHHHLSGSGFSEWWYELAADPTKNGGYTYYTLVSNTLCHSGKQSALRFHTISKTTWARLPPCIQKNYTELGLLDDNLKREFMDSIRLHTPSEGREEFFSTHWQRLNELTANPTLVSKILLRNMQAYQKENLQYLETQVNVRYTKKPDGSPYTPDEALGIYTDMLASDEAQATQVTVRFQYALVRFLPDAEAQLEWIYDFVDSHRDLYVGINLVGREDDMNGQPKRFASTLRKLRAKYPKVSLAFHAGESETADTNVRDTLLLGAERIGHGLNTIFDPDTLLLMRNGQYLIEINLISNLLLEYIPSYDAHPFPEYLRTGIPTALSTDDRGMFDSTLTDEFYVAVTEFNLSWEEVLTLGTNSLQYSFLQPDVKAQQLALYHQRVAGFERLVAVDNVNTPTPKFRAFICTFESELCSNDKD